MKKLAFISLASILVITGAFGCLFTSCCPDVPGTNEVLEAYLQKDSTVTPQLSGFSAYFDFSNGMQSAYADTATQQVLQGIVNKVTGQKDVKCFSLADNEITELPIKTTALYNSIMDFENSYTKQYAPIEKTLDRIVNENRSALLITDFEEYTGQIQKSAFATPYFNKWLDGGNEITFYITDYKEGNKDKHLYYIIFDSPKRELLKDFEDGLNGKPKNYQKFLLSTSAFELSTDYLAATKGGNYHDSQGNDNVTVVNEKGDGESFTKYDGLFAEYYPLGCSWTDIVGNASSLTEDGVPAKDKFLHLLSKLFLDLSHQDSFDIQELDIQVTDIQQDFESFSNYYLALAKKGTDDELDYFDERGNLKKEFQYVPQSITEVKDMLLFDKALFDSGLKKNHNHIELAVNLDPKFNGSFARVQDEDMLRIDIIITKCEPILDKLPELFKWTGNDNLYESIKNTLEAKRPTGKIIYSYFLRVCD